MTVRKTTSTDAVRLFVGVKIDVSTPLEATLARLADMGKAVKPVRSGQLHVTLHFYGDVEQAIVPELADLLDVVAGAHEAFDWTLFGTGAFPSRARPNVVWAGAEDCGRFAQLARDIESLGESLGAVGKHGPFHAHVTLARVKFRPPAELDTLLRETSATDFGPQRAKEIVLFQSVLAPSGPAYTPLHTAALGGHADSSERFDR